ncbi:MAG: fatty acid cis/trans isomerase [Dechloromonas sp.]|nr:fatty acid cis/trans isomerase [Dechloromonas sp.]
MRLLPPFLIAFVAGCATVVGTMQLDDRFGPADPARFDHPPARVADAPDYWKEVRPLLDQRCVSCHACYDAPCQLNLTSYEGLTRGANPKPVYSAARMVADEPTRLGFDALTNAGWRQKGFFPVLNERTQTPEANRDGGVMYRMLALKQMHPGPDSGPVTNPDLDFSLDRTDTCARAETFDEYSRKHPERGMPFGMPPLAKGEQQTLARWLESGSPYTPGDPVPDAALAQVADWERFLNGDSLREQLVARYIFEHWYIGHFHVEAAPGRYFQLVRSRTPPGQPIDVVATRRPYDDPGVPRVYYRLRYSEATQVAKTFMPMQLDAARMERIRQWFFVPNYVVDVLPGYEIAKASNPFATFRALPVDARYRFMLDDAQFIMMGFMKGPVCRGQVALNVINDLFWVAFVAPSASEAAATTELLDADIINLQLPAEHDSTASLLAWRGYAKLEQRFLKEKSRLLIARSEKQPPAITKLWDGDGTNPNAALTVFRHFDSASVMRGYAGERPQTMLVIGYPLFERMHYLLLAGYDVFGNVGHQLATRLYMDFLRMEGELNFLTFLPIEDRQPVLDFWYRGRKEETGQYFTDVAYYFPNETGIQYRSKDHLGELYRMIARRMAPLRNPNLDWKNTGLAPAEIAQMRKLSQIHGIPASVMPEQSLLLINRPNGHPQIVSLVRNTAHTNVAEMFDEAERLRPKEDTLLALDGVVGAYPNAFFAVDPEKLPNFVEAVGKLGTEADLVQLTERFGVRRTDPRFWPTSDALHAEWRRTAPKEAAVLDYSRFENR